MLIDKVYTNFRGLNVPEDDLECESFTVISMHFFLQKQISAIIDRQLPS